MLEVQDTTVARRPPDQVMRLARLGSFHQSRLSFMRILTRRMQAEAWTFARPEFVINEQGVGHAVYSATGPDRTYSLVAFAHDLPADQRSDRVIAEAWDATFTLFDGVPAGEDIDRLSRNVPLQEAGRVSESELCLARANRSVRLWDHVVSELAEGRQPDSAQIAKVGYLMRTTAVYGSGKFGAADREVIADRPELQVPFQAEMLAVYLIRTFVRDLVQHMAQQRGGAKTATLDPKLARALGIGNSTGLGMAPFLINHPVLINNWIIAREEAIARVRSLPAADATDVTLFGDIVQRMRKSAALWHSVHPIQIDKLAALRPDLDRLIAYLKDTDLTVDHPWDRLYLWAEAELSVEGQECVASMILEPYGDIVDGLASCMADDLPNPPIDGTMTLGNVLEQIGTVYDWALEIDWSAPDSTSRAWYVSEEKLEPRLGERFEEPIEAYEQPLAPARDVARMALDIKDWPLETRVGEFLMRHPEHRHTLRRVQLADRAPYGEIRDNTISAQVLPIDMLRCKLAFFGAQHFDPRSDRWVRICMYGNAPYPEELAQGDADFWPYPDIEGLA
jgi:hypothetical protein